MPNFFSIYWVYRLNHGLEDTPADRAFTDVFKQRGVHVGDVCYILSNIGGRPFLVARMTVSEVIVGLSNLRKAGFPNPPHNQAVRGKKGTRVTFKRPIPMAVANKMRFISGKLIRPLVWEAPGVLDRQTIRGVRRITPETAQLLDTILDAN